MSGADLLASRCAALPEALRGALACDVPEPVGRVVATGVGLSEGPARFLVAIANERGCPALYLPLSELAAPRLRVEGDTLFVFSQGLSPNARFALAHLGAFRKSVLVTSVAPDASAPPNSPAWTAACARARGAELVVLPPREEPELLVRVLGPAIATLAAALAFRLPGLEAVPDAYARALAAPPATIVRGGAVQPIALVASGRYAEGCHGLRCKLLEGLLVPEPPIWDLLQIPHGPLQSFYERVQTLLVLERAEPHERPLLDRLAALLVPERHALVRLPSTLPGMLAWFEHDALLNALVVAAVRELGRDLTRWPAQGRDGALYDLAPDLA